MNNVKHAIFLFGIITTFNLPAKIFSGRENIALEKIGIYYINMLAHLNFKIKRQHFGTIKLPLGWMILLSIVPCVLSGTCRLIQGPLLMLWGVRHTSIGPHWSSAVGKLGQHRLQD